MTSQMVFNASKTWIPKHQIQEPRIWLIDDNSGPQFLVIGEYQTLYIYRIPDSISVYCHELTDSNSYQHWEKLKACFDKRRSDLQLLYMFSKFEGIWAGFDPSYYGFHFRAILVKMHSNSYILVSNSQIEDYNPDEEIYDFMAYMGENDVTYPFMWSQNKIYYTNPVVWIYSKDLPPKEEAVVWEWQTRLLGETGLAETPIFRFDELPDIKSQKYPHKVLYNVNWQK